MFNDKQNDDRRWYAVRTRSRFEKSVGQNLSSKDVETYLPVVLERRRWADRTKVVEIPLFSGYVFIRMTDKADQILMVLTTPGVVDIVSQGGSIEPIPDQQIENVRQILKSGAGCVHHLLLEEGDRVRVRSGPFKGIEGTLVRFRNNYRLVVTIELLSQSVATEIDISDVERIQQRKVA